MKLDNLKSTEQMESFLNGSQAIAFTVASSKDERYEFVEDDMAYERLSHISISHIYNLRKSLGYKKHRYHYEKTKSTKGIHIGERRKPQANGKPGYIRIDTVHQGDLDGCKGVYHINAVDEVTQFEVVVSVEKISEAYLVPALEILLASFHLISSTFTQTMVANMLIKP